MTNRIVLGTTETRGDLTLDLPELLTSGAYIQGNSGSGKSGLIRRLLEQTHGRVQHIILDAEGDYVTLAERFAYVVCGRGFPVPAEVESAAALALKLYEYRISAIVDVHDLDLQEQQRFVSLFAGALITHARRLGVTERQHVLVVIDEVQLFAPEQSTAESSSVLVDLANRGRRYGLHPILANQRLSQVDKGVVAQIPNKLFGRTTLTLDMRRVGDELGLPPTERRLLRELQTREFYAYGPALCQEPTKFRVGDVETRMPKIGELGAFHVPEPTPELQAALEALAGIEGEAPPEPAVVRNERTTAQSGHMVEMASRELSRQVNELQAKVRELQEANGYLASEWVSQEERIQTLSGERDDLLRRIERAAEALGWPEGIEKEPEVIRADTANSSAGRDPRARETHSSDRGGAGRTKRPATHRGARNSVGASGSVAQLPALASQPGGVGGDGGRTQGGRRATTPDAQRLRVAEGRDTADMKDEEVFALVERAVAAAVDKLPSRVVYVPPAEALRLEYQQRAVERVIAKVDAFGPDEREAFRFLLGQGRPLASRQIGAGLAWPDITTNKAVKALLDGGMIAKAGGGGNGVAVQYKPNLREWVERELAPHTPKDEEVEQVYQAVLGRIAGG